ncbi:GntR family transcriptional regulator [Bifidobacterium olomucense]|uniref:GntR family transcriptional regulator n=1 Tax=Bifidobacterium olomucense TaxID=2675324 RepID=A0A7Y0HY42_9BIFI|nr:GntR family transcriptional regulator [Bifidobacterium sp. DSM 109959]
MGIRGGEDPVSNAAHMHTPSGTSPAASCIQQLRLLIELGHYEPGERLGSERLLAEQMGVSRSVLRAALSVLEREGRIVRLIGRNGGIMISDGRLERSLNTTESLPDIAKRQGHVLKSRVLSAQEFVAEALDRRQLGLNSGDHIYRITRLRITDQAPLMLEDSRFPASRFPNLLSHDLTQSIYHILSDEYGAQRGESHETLTVEEATQDEADLLQVALGEPLIRITRITRDRSGRLIEAADDRYIAARMRFTLASPGYVRLSASSKTA